MSLFDGLSQVIQQEALTRLLIEKGIFAKQEFWGMAKVVDREMKLRAQRWFKCNLIRFS
jgi:hypothetical protein